MEMENIYAKMVNIIQDNGKMDLNGKRTLYDSNGNIWYEGNFVNDELEGYGKYIYEDDTYYIGQFKNFFWVMEKQKYIIQMEIYCMKVILFVIKETDMENIFMKVVIIMQDNLKMN